MYKWIMTALAAAGVGWIAQRMGCDPAALRFYVITTVALCLWIMNLYPESLVAVITPVIYILAGVGGAREILAVWTSPIGWLVLGGLIIGDMMSETGVSKRLALAALRVCGGSLENLLWGIVLAGIIISPFVPTSMGKAAMLGIIITGVCRTLGLEPRSREASCLFLAGLTAVAAPKFLFYTASVDAVMLVELMRKAGMEISWLSYARINAPLGLAYAALCVLLLRLLFRPRSVPGLAALVEAEWRGLGPVTRKEAKALALLGLLAVALATDAWHGLDSGWVMLLAAGACFLPGVRLMEQNRIPALPLHIVFYVVGSMSIGVAAHAAGVDAAVVRALAPLLQEGGNLWSFGAVYLCGAGLLMGLTSLPAIATFTVPIAEAGLRLGGAEQALPYAFLYGLDQCLMPYCYGPALYMFALGYINMRHFVLFQGIKLIMGAIFIVLLAYPLWRLML